MVKKKLKNSQKQSTSKDMFGTNCCDLILFPLKKIKLKYLALIFGVLLLYTFIFYGIYRNFHYLIKLDINFKQNKTIFEMNIKHSHNEYNNTSTSNSNIMLNNTYEHIDWHDYDFLATEKNKQGFGEGGQGEIVPEDEKQREKLQMTRYGFNGLISDRIALNRSIKDIRPSKCWSMKYLSKLPSASVIIVFNNEHLKTLIRTCVSVINRTPAKLLDEIILVNDGSDMEELGEPLDDSIKSFGSKIRLIRLPNRTGLIRARLIGAKSSKSDILVYLDAHCEVNTNWLPPLLDPIAKNHRVVMCPTIDRIHEETFEYDYQDNGARGAFDWNFDYKRLPRLPESLANPEQNFQNPIMAGGLFAISAKYFWELGGYDEGLDIWGGEQYELSFKIWMCGGEMYDAPCSRVGHVFRPVDHRPDIGDDHVYRNYKRVAEVWMDEYKQFIYENAPEWYTTTITGDLSKQKALRQQLKCKSFKWFMENIAFDFENFYPSIEPPTFAWGAIQNLYDPTACIIDKETLEIGECRNISEPEDNQYFVLTWRNEIRDIIKEHCLDVMSNEKNASVVQMPCHLSGGNQYWRYDMNKKWIIHGVEQKHCLDVDDSNENSARLIVNVCDATNLKMKWTFGNLNETTLN